MESRCTTGPGRPAKLTVLLLAEHRLQEGGAGCSGATRATQLYSAPRQHPAAASPPLLPSLPVDSNGFFPLSSDTILALTDNKLDPLFDIGRYISVAIFISDKNMGCNSWEGMLHTNVRTCILIAVVPSGGWVHPILGLMHTGGKGQHSQ